MEREELRQEKPIRSENPGRILLVGVILVFVSTPFISYLREHGMESLADAINTVRFSYLLAFFVFWLYNVVNHPVVQRSNPKESKMIKDMIQSCLEEARSENEGESIGTLELVGRVGKKLEQEGIFYITYPQINHCIEQMISSDEYGEAGVNLVLPNNSGRRKIWRFLACYATVCLPGWFIVWLLGSTGVIYLKH